MNSGHLAIVLPAVLLWLALWLAAVSSIVRQHRMSLLARFVWIVVALVFPVLGPVLWFASRHRDPRVARSEL